MNAKHDDRYFLTTVKLHEVKNRIERILEDSKEHALVPSIELMAACVKDLGHAMVEVHRARLSDGRFKIRRDCQTEGCWNQATEQWLCEEHSPK